MLLSIGTVLAGAVLTLGMTIPVQSVDGHHVGRSLTARDDQAAKKPFPLRILPLGASITFGIKSTDKNGYRQAIRDQLRFEGWEVDMVGGVRSGNMKDNDCEGHPGAVVGQMPAFADKSIPYQPNLVLINAGTNDATVSKPSLPIEKVGDRMQVLLDKLYKEIPNVTIVLSTLLPNANNVTDERVRSVANPIYRDIVQQRRSRGDRIVLADMYKPKTGRNESFISKSDLKDGTHPTDAGYRKMAAVWWHAFQEAENANMLVKPADIKAANLPAGGQGDDSNKAPVDPKLPDAC